QDHVRQDAGQHHHRQFGTIEKHYHQHEDRNNSIQQGLGEVVGKRSLNGLSTFKAGDHVAKIPLFKKCDGQPHQMREQVGIPLEFQCSAKIKSSPASQSAKEGLQHHQQHEANPERQQQVVIADGNHFVHGQLQEERAQDSEQ